MLTPDYVRCGNRVCVVTWPRLLLVTVICAIFSLSYTDGDETTAADMPRVAGGGGGGASSVFRRAAAAVAAPTCGQR